MSISTALRKRSLTNAIIFRTLGSIFVATRLLEFADALVQTKLVNCWGGVAAERCLWQNNITSTRIMLSQLKLRPPEPWDI